MSELHTHDLNEVVATEPGRDESPGNWVRHVNYERTLGVVVAHDPTPQGFSQQPQVTVLWSKAPPILRIQTQEIKATSRQLRVGWSLETSPDIVKEHDRQLKSDIINHHISPSEAKASDPDIDDIEFSHRMDSYEPEINIKRVSHDRRDWYEQVYDSMQGDGRVPLRHGRR